MKPIKLSIEAFGAFNQKQEIDFEAFSQYGLFLVHGPTGAGKTTIFDAICVALFGETTSARDPAAMRSQYAQDKDDTKIVLVFKAQQKCYRVERRFSLNRKGDELNKKSVFSEVDPLGFTETGLPITKEKEIEKVVEKIVGFTVNQFKQIVVLPQGKFSEFLKAKTSEKQVILAQLFGTEIYKVFREKLKAKAEEHRKELEQREGQRQAILATLGLANEAILAEQIGQLALDIQQLNTQSEGIKAKVAAANAALHEAQQLAKTYDDLAANRAHLHTYREQENTYQTKKHQLDYANRAALLQAEIELEKTLQSDLVLRQNEHKKAQAGQQETSKNLIEKKQKFTKEAEAHKTTINDYDELLKKLENTLPLFGQIENLEAELQAFTANSEAKEKALVREQTALEAHQAQLVAGKQQLADLEPAAEGLPVLTLELETLNKVLVNGQKRDQLGAALTKAREGEKTALQKLAEAVVARQQAVADYDALELNWIKGQAARLSLTLADGQPCPVCGSLTHPLKASTADLVADDDLAEAKERRETAMTASDLAKEAHQKTQLVVGEYESNLAAILSQLGDHAQSASAVLAKLHQAKQQQFQAAQKAQTDLAKLRPANQALDQTIADNQAKIQLLSHELIEITTKKDGKTDRLGELRRELPPKCEDRQTVEKRIANGREKKQNALDERARAAEEIQQLEVKAAKLESDCQNLATQIDQLLAKQTALRAKNQQAATAQGFASPAAAQQAYLPETERQALEKDIQRWQSERDRLQAEQARLASVVKDRPRPDLALLAAQLATADQANDQYHQTLAEKETIRHNWQAQLTQLTELKDRLAQKEALAKPYLELSHLASDKNARKITLDTYIIFTLLDEVLHYTNRRLRVMSNGRYEIGRIEDPDQVKGGGGKGLELEVFDAYTGKKREVNNLSGGETFFTSLALALGLADVASAQQGGVRVEALFIDEGFGTLDSETLDFAIGTLTELETQHRLVGIISHVGELRERIPARIEVRKGNNGSDIQVHLPNQ